MCGGLGHDRDECQNCHIEKGIKSSQPVRSCKGKPGTSDHGEEAIDAKLSTSFGKDAMEREIEEEESLKNY
jgi:hypothetical protein